jgi:hypothetical protein
MKRTIFWLWKTKGEGEKRLSEERMERRKNGMKMEERKRDFWKKELKVNERVNIRRGREEAVERKNGMEEEWKWKKRKKTL